MRRLLGLVLTLSLTGPAWADDKAPKHNTLTPQEVADGWILLWDGETTFGWTAPNESKWTVLDGMLAPQAGKPGLLVTTTAFKDYELSLEYQVRPQSMVKVLVNCDEAGKPRIAEKKSDKDEKGEKDFRPSQNSPRLQYMGNNWAVMRLRVVGGMARDVRFETLNRGSRTQPGGPAERDPLPQVGHVAFSGNGVIFRSIKLKPINTKSLFNGKDLTGWKKFEGNPRQAKSEFAVSKEGWITIKNGPGDLATTGSYDDFVLQLDCRTNGPRLNSGVFFRCRPNEYQNGYEAQIHNGWLDKPKEYTVEEYDPQTNKLKEKKKVQSAAMDYGTGAIYRRIPARKAVAKDNEWFTMTVVAQGRHVATWVNGVQVVDWVDNRPVNSNARNGCRLEKGPISLQGHDPTTDLSFRNFRIAELNGSKEQPKLEEKK
jgi:hypothetical protein